ncbi:MAG: amidohydrolase family protein, partial [Armatimonadetes bacterium]|nr:amidohydrolase family protein [Armatimonadota bacterium]
RLLELHHLHGVGPLHVAHVARAREVQAIRTAKARRQPVTAEVTPHHLFLTVDDLDRLGPLGDMRPTLQTADDAAALWAGLADGTIDAVASDHAPHLLAEKSQSPPPPGVPGLQTMLPLLLTAVSEGRIAVPDLVRWSSRNPAAIHALRNKGEVRVGADADLVVVDRCVSPGRARRWLRATRGGGRTQSRRHLATAVLPSGSRTEDQ